MFDQVRIRYDRNDGTARGWVREGAVFEDNTDTVKRPLNHFLDPLRNRPLNVFGIPLLNDTSPDWALEDRGDIGAQAFSLKDARDALYRALTQREKQKRDRAFGEAFETLGHVIHHLQDMTQPQHVRNDAHLDQPEEFELFGLKLPNPFFNPSRFEKWGLDHSNEITPYLDAGLYTSRLPNPEAGVTYATARAFWTGGVSGDGRGLADFTNRNFLSAGTLWIDLQTPNGDYPSPTWDTKAPEVVQFHDLMNGEPECSVPAYDPECGRECGPPVDVPLACQLGGQMAFYATDVVDRYAGKTEKNGRAATLSIFDQDLQPTGQRVFALNRFNFRATYPFLMPRAVAYSAGLLDFFFRGRLEVNDVSEVDGTLRVEVRNEPSPVTITYLNRRPT